MLKRLLISLALCFLPATAGAFNLEYPLTTPCTVTVAGTAAQAAVNTASPGQVVCVQAGSSSFSVDIPGGKNIILAGAAAWGGGVTTQTGGGITQHNVGSAVAGSRVTGFTITSPQIPLGYIKGVAGFRYDHIIINRALWTETYTVVGSQDAGDPLGPSYSRYKPSGLFDHFTCTNCRFVATGEWSGSGLNQQGGRVRWSEANTFGDTNCWYIEDSTFTLTDFSGGSIHNFADGNVGGCWVVRFNDATNTYTEQHSVQGGSSRGMRRWELYFNRMTVNSSLPYPFAPPTRTRGGSGIIMGNYFIEQGHTWNPQNLDVDNVRSYDSGRWDGFCGTGPGGSNADGTAPIDGNQPGKGGYPCRDQVGTGQDTFLWQNDGVSGTYLESPTSNIPAQALVPAYFFLNRIGGGPIPSGVMGWELSREDVASMFLQFVDGQNIFTEAGANCVSGGACSTGVGSGTVLPVTCTVNTGFWKTNEGNWNRTTSNSTGVQLNGTSGVLYKCVSPNIWNLYWIPAQYPHPLQPVTGSVDLPPATPQNFLVQ